jgi:hypothetical protein
MQLLKRKLNTSSMPLRQLQLFDKKMNPTNETIAIVQQGIELGHSEVPCYKKLDLTKLHVLEAIAIARIQTQRSLIDSSCTGSPSESTRNPSHPTQILMRNPT